MKKSPKISNNPNYRIRTCKYCGKPCPRYITKGPSDMILASNDPRAGPLPYHKCYINYLKSQAPINEPKEERYPKDDIEGVLKAFGF